MKKFFLLLFIVMLCVSCSNQKQATAKSIKNENIKATHSYKNGTLTCKVKVVNSDLIPDIKLSLKSANGDEVIKDVPLERSKDTFIGKIKIKKEGYWNIDYTVNYNDNIFIKSYTEMIGAIDKNNFDTFEIKTIPDVIRAGENVTFSARLLNGNRDNISNGEVILQFEQTDYNYSLTKAMKNNGNNFELTNKFDKPGIYKLIIHVRVQGKNHNQEISIPVEK